MSIKLTDTIETTQANSGGAKVTRTITELNDLISTEESGRLDALEASVDTAGTGLLDRMTAAEGDIDDLEAMAPTSGAPVTAQVAASAVLTSDGTAVTEGSTVTVNDVTYKFKTTLTTVPSTVPNEVLIGASSDESLTNLKLAINGEATEGTNYSTGTEQPTDVTAAVDTGANTVTVTATTAGTGGNAYPKATDDAHLDWDGTGAFFTGGLDITAAPAGALRYESGKLWVSIGESTATVSNWEYASLT